jgi:hypothetical protein
LADSFELTLPANAQPVGVANHYLDSETRFDVAARHNGALTLLYLLIAKDAKAARLEKNEPHASDFEIRRL